MDAKDISAGSSRGGADDRHASDELTALDQAIGDGDHGMNMKRGFEGPCSRRSTRSPGKSAGGAEGDRHDAGDEGRRRLRAALWHAVHGAGQGLPAEPTRRLARALAAAIAAVKARGKSERGQKTMLDVLVRLPRSSRWASMRDPVSGTGGAEPPRPPSRCRRHAAGPPSSASARSVIWIRARARPALMMGAVSVPWSNGHDQQQCRHRHRLAFEGCGEGAADMVRQMVGTEVPLAWTGGDPDGGLGTERRHHGGDRPRLVGKGVAVLVDLGGAETNSEMAIEMLPADRRGRVVICNAPVVEGAVMAATESSAGRPRRGAQHGRGTLCRGRSSHGGHGRAPPDRC